MSYKNTLLSWLGREESSFWEHASSLSDFDRLRNAIGSGTSDELLFTMADSLAKDIKSNHEKRKKERPNSIHLITHEDSNGTVSFYNKRTGELMTCLSKKGDNYDYIGPFDYENPLAGMYGRGGVYGQGSPHDQYSDGKFFNYGSGKKAAAAAPVFYFIGSGENFNYDKIGKILAQHTKE